MNHTGTTHLSILCIIGTYYIYFFKLFDFTVNCFCFCFSLDFDCFFFDFFVSLIRFRLFVLVLIFDHFGLVFFRTKIANKMRGLCVIVSENGWIATLLWVFSTVFISVFFLTSCLVSFVWFISCLLFCRRLSCGFVISFLATSLSALCIYFGWFSKWVYVFRYYYYCYI